MTYSPQPHTNMTYSPQSRTHMPYPPQPHTNTMYTRSIQSKNNIKKNVSHLATERGFSLMEMLVVVTISVLLMGISITVFRAMTNKQIVEKDTEIIYAALQEMRNKTLVGQNGSQFGIYFASSSVTTFEGTSYSLNNPTNKVESFSPRSEISAIRLGGATSTIYFSKVSGRPSATGTIEVRLKSDSTLMETITIYQSGLSEVQ